jgi:deazaflavin-dependent oxidoreductase (nitroreductase family)
VGPRLVRADRELQRRTRGRFSVIGRAQVPMLLLTTVGHRTGAARTTPLIYAHDGDDYIVTASNWGQPRHPAWSDNLLAEPGAQVTVSGRQIPVTARLASPGERDRAWRLVQEVWPAYQTYQQRTERELRIFMLQPRK